MTRKVPEGYVPLKVFCEMAGVSVWTGRRWIKEGRIEAVKVGNRWYVPVNVANHVKDERMKKFVPLPAVEPRDVYLAYKAVVDYCEIGVPLYEAIRTKIGEVSRRKAYNLLRFLRSVGLIEGRGRSIRPAVEGLNRRDVFFAEVSRRLREMYGWFLNEIDGLPDDIDIIYRVLREKNVDVTLSGLRGVIRVLRRFGILVSARRLFVSGGDSLEEIVYNFVVKSGGYVKAKRLKELGLNSVDLKSVVRNLVQGRRARLVDVPKSVVMVSKAIGKAYGAKPEESFVVTSKAVEYERLVKLLSEMYGIDEKRAEDVVKQALLVGREVFYIYQDRVRADGKMRKYVAGRGVLPDDYIIGVVE